MNYLSVSTKLDLMRVFLIFLAAFALFQIWLQLLTEYLKIVRKLKFHTCVSDAVLILSEDVRDGDTLIGSIAGAGAAFYGPNTSPNSGTAQLQIGSAITQDLYDVVKINEVNGQTLAPPNRAVVDKQMRFVAPNVIENDGTKDFTIDFTFGADDWC